MAGHVSAGFGRRPPALPKPRAVSPAWPPGRPARACRAQLAAPLAAWISRTERVAAPLCRALRFAGQPPPVRTPPSAPDAAGESQAPAGRGFRRCARPRGNCYDHHLHMMAAGVEVAQLGAARWPHGPAQNKRSPLWMASRFEEMMGSPAAPVCILRVARKRHARRLERDLHGAEQSIPRVVSRPKGRGRPPCVPRRARSSARSRMPTR